MQNEALIFIKPHAVNDKCIEFVESFLKEKGINLLKKGRLSATEIKEQGLIDKHYFAIAKAAVENKPEQLELTSEAIENFEKGFGVSWKELCQQGKVLNGADLQVKMKGISGLELNNILSSCKQVKMAPGLYAAYLEKEGLYGINGFYLALREVFTSEGNEIVWYHGSFDPEKLSWHSFRHQVIGATDPVKACSGSLRHELYERFEEFGLPRKPSMSENGVHASAGPIEGLRERQVWLGCQLSGDPLGQLLESKGLQNFLDNPVVTLNNQQGHIFDLTEDQNTVEVISSLENQSK